MASYAVSIEIFCARRFISRRSGTRTFARCSVISYYLRATLSSTCADSTGRRDFETARAMSGRLMGKLPRRLRQRRAQHRGRRGTA